MITTPGRWTDPAWQASALAWVDDGPGAGRTGWSQPRVRPWSTALRIERGHGEPLWLKANGDGTRHEASLLAALAARRIPHTPEPVRIDGGRGFTLLPDGGPTSRRRTAA